MSGGGFGLGNIGSALGNIASSALQPVNLAGSAIGSVGGVGSVLGPALQLAGGASPLGVFGSSLAGEVLKSYTESGGSADKPLFIDAAGNPIYADRGYNYGANTYKIGDRPLDASKYFISGDKGVYNLLPMLGSLYGDTEFAAKPGTSSYNLYNDIYSKMADDAAAQKAFSERFGVKEVDPRSFMSYGQGRAYTKGYDPRLAGIMGYDVPRLGAYGTGKNNALGILGTQGIKTMNPSTQNRIFGGSIFNPVDMVTAKNNLSPYLADDLNQAFLEYNPSDKFMISNSNRRNFQAPTIDPIKYVDFGFSEKASEKEPWEAVANYASQYKNPFFLGYAPETSASTTTAPAPAMTVAPMPTTAPVSVPALAPFTAPVSTLAPTPTTAPAPAPTMAPASAPTMAPAPVSGPQPAPFRAPSLNKVPTLADITRLSGRPSTLVPGLTQNQRNQPLGLAALARKIR